METDNINFIDILEKLAKLNKELLDKVEFLTKRVRELEELVLRIQKEMYFEKIKEAYEIECTYCQFN